MRPSLVTLFTITVAAGTVFGVGAALTWSADRYRDYDFIGFRLGSRALLMGADPYDVATWLALHRDEGSRGFAILPPNTGFGYPLTTAVVFAPFALLPLTLAAPLWLATQVALALAALAALGRRLFPTTLRRDLVLLVLIAASSPPVWALVRDGNLGGFELAIPAGAIALLLGGRPFAAGAVAGLVVAKPHLYLVAIPVLLLALPRQTALRTVAGAAASAGPILALSFLLRPGWVSEWLGPLGSIASYPVGRATVFGLFPPGLRWLAWAVVPAIIVACAWWIRRSRPAFPFVAAVVLPLSLLAAPYAWSEDQGILFVSAAVTIALAAQLADVPRAKVLALLALAVVALPWLRAAVSGGEQVWGALTPLAVIAVLVVAARQPPPVWHDSSTA